MSNPEATEWQPATLRVIEGADAVKALADPLRLRLLQLLMRSHEKSWTVKEIAAELTQPVTKLYHHIKILEAVNLVTDVESRLVSGIVEHRYRSSQRSLRFDDELFGRPETRYDSITQVAALIDATRDELVDYLYLDDADIENTTISKFTARFTPDEVAKMNHAIEAMMEEFDAHRDDPERAHLERTSMLFLMHPLRHDALD